MTIAFKIKFASTGLQIIFPSWKDICLTKSLFWLDKTEMWLDVFFFKLLFLSGSLFEIIIFLSLSTYYLGKKFVQT